ncbi:unnamed protein product [Cochlearia groenlandica]
MVKVSMCGQPKRVWSRSQLCGQGQGASWSVHELAKTCLIHKLAVGALSPCLSPYQATYQATYRFIFLLSPSLSLALSFFCLNLAL